ncbi:tektin-4 isoform X2 [Scomber scombrus]|uniref:Tektin-4 isoform X2 n=1 Tax=Scomber scombrus TaxID=13677 RepID=A0AAV1QJI9_SCOSC
MSSEVLVSWPHFDSRAVAQGVLEKEAPVEPEVPQPSLGSATAGYHSAKYTYLRSLRPNMELCRDEHQLR